MDDPSILNMGDPSILNMGAITPNSAGLITPKSASNDVIDPTVANQIASLGIGSATSSNKTVQATTMTHNGRNAEMDRYTWQQTQGILNGHPNGSRRWRSQHSNSPRVSAHFFDFFNSI